MTRGRLTVNIAYLKDRYRIPAPVQIVFQSFKDSRGHGGAQQLEIRRERILRAHSLRHIQKAGAEILPGEEIVIVDFRKPKGGKPVFEPGRDLKRRRGAGTQHPHIGFRRDNVIADIARRLLGQVPHALYVLSVTWRPKQPGGAFIKIRL